MKFRNYAIIVAIVLLGGFAQVCSAGQQNSINSLFDTRLYQIEPEEETAKPDLSESYASKSYAEHFADHSVFKIGLEAFFNTTVFMGFGINFELGFPNIFDGYSAEIGFYEGLVASESSNELGIFFSMKLVGKYTFNIDSFIYPGIGIKYLAGVSGNFIDESREYHSLGPVGFIRIPFAWVLLLEFSMTLELITDRNHSVAICFDFLMGFHF